MTEIIMHGCNGHMGQVITSIVEKDDEAKIVAGVDITGEKLNDYPVFKNISDCNVKADVIIDFSAAAALEDVLEYSQKNHIPAVLCSTGLSNEQVEKIKACSEKVALLKSANMSLGINMLMNLLKTAVKVLNPEGFDIEIVERHHNLKKDAPSGTALALADAMNEALEKPYSYNYDRSKDNEPRKKEEIGIVALRGGNIVGEHEVVFAGNDEVIEFKHTATSKAVFAKGAVAAAKFLKNKESGLFDMADVISAAK
ncbi:dihydrodipicolinate reductase [Acetitomaculum ruminis DSM 5522]|uniref:4-hydroxy-tetrahydrodipicolinate reductase n=1 Tax=Acetitomaculum ruminis DSM 5522 TaxID=1120918 RepID=A0A1I0Z636_9FIRM|nr:4-hydroxy-tetrahydrodipicolinate reductase [Acetitomaculum ruminis]SFB21011.1 dihydrodipicolinate reductase [Acetitomaculum ruminis DSM 5522]